MTSAATSTGTVDSVVPAAASTAAEGRAEQTREVLGPLVKLVLNARLVSLLLVLIAAPARSLEAVLTLLLMATTSVLPVLLWGRIGAVVLRHPMAVSIDLAVAGSLLVFAPDSVVALYAITTAILTGVLYGRLGGVSLTSPLLLAFVAGLARSGAVDSFATAALLPCLLVSGAFLGAELRRLLLQREEAIDLARRSLERAAVAEERARLSRELHDSVAKTVQGLALSAASVPLLAEHDPQGAAAQVEAIRAAAQRASTETRQVLAGLRMDDPSIGLGASIEAAVAHWSEAQRTPASAHTELTVEPGVDVRYELFQILREALHNIAKHASADHVEVTVTATDGQVELVVRDDGAGFDVPQDLEQLSRAGHIGVLGFHERAATIGGEVTVTSAPGHGTQVRVLAPLSAERRVAP